MSKGSEIRAELEKLMRQRIVVIDGAMGTTIREYKAKGLLNEAEARGTRFKDNDKDLLNNGDILSVTKPEIIEDIHKRFLEAGADIIETNTFSGTSIAQSEFFVEDPREKGGRKDPEFFQEDHRGQVPQRPRVGDQLQVRASVSEVGGHRGRADGSQALRRGCGGAIDGVAVPVPGLAGPEPSAM